MRQPNDTMQRPGPRAERGPGQRRREEDDRGRTPSGPIASDPVDTLPDGVPHQTTTSVKIGRVDSFSVGESGLTIKLNTSAISRSIILVEADAPHFRTAVSIAMMAYNARYNVGLLNGDSTNENQEIAIRVGPPDRRGWETAVAIGLGRESLEFGDWIFRLEDTQRT